MPDDITLEPLEMRGVTVAHPVALAPMAGYTDPAFRSLCREHGCGVTLTEVVNAEAIVRGSRRTLHLLETSPGERPVGAHIYGADPGVMGEAAAAIERLGGFDFVDINCGCPVRKIVAKGAGAALMAAPDTVESMVRTVRGAMSMAVTLKTRTGLAPGAVTIDEVAQAAEEGGASAVFVHARLASDKHSGPADWETLARVKSARSVPVIGNGGIESAEDAVAMLRQTGVDGVMVGRAAVGNPWIFGDIRRRLGGRRPTTHGLAEHRAVVMDHFERMLTLKTLEYSFRKRARWSAEEAAVLHFRPHLLKYLSGLNGCGEVRRRLNDIRSGQELRALVDLVIAQEQKAGGEVGGTGLG